MAGRSVFISHASKDRSIANEICERLEFNGVKCWIAPRDISPGAAYTAAIIDGLHECAVCLLVLSANANRSGPVANEVERARSYGKLIIPFRIEAVLPGKELELYVSQSQWVDAYASPIADRIDYIAMVVHAAESKQSPPPPPPQRLTFGAKAELLLERTVRHRILAATSAAALLALIGAAGIWMQWGTRDVVSRASGEISSAAIRTERASEEIGNSAKAVAETGKQIGAVGGKLDVIGEGVKAAKKETSLDPRKEVANLGATWDQSAFEEAIIREDLRLVDLYLAGGMKISALFMYHTARRGGPDMSEQMATRVISAAKNDDRAQCERLTSYDVTEWLSRSNIRRAMFSVCDPSSLRARIAAQAREIERKSANHDKTVAEANAARARCKSDLSAAYRGKVGTADLVGVQRLADQMFEKHYLSMRFGPNAMSDERSRDYTEFTLAVLSYSTPMGRSQADTITYAAGLTCAKKIPSPKRPPASDLEQLRSALRLLPERLTAQ